MSGVGVSIMAVLAVLQADAAEAPPPAPAAATEEPCRDIRPTGNEREIVICAQRPQGYRLNPDVMASSRAARQQRNPPKPPERPKGAPTLCEHIGGCTGLESIDWVSTAIVAGTMAAKAAKGENVGKMFVTRPEATEYELYLAAKREREALEAEAALDARVKAMKAEDQKAAPAAKAPAGVP